MLSTPRLDAQAAMQSRPFGSNTAMYRDPSTEAMTRGYRQQKSDFMLARRMLRNQARQGDSKAALALTGISDTAEKAGINMGMESRDQVGANAARRLMDRQAQVRRDALEQGRNQAAAQALDEARVSPEPAVAPAPAPEAAPALTPFGAGDEGDMVMPETRLGRLAGSAYTNKDFTEEADKKFKQGLVGALGQTNDPAEIAELKRIAGQVGVTSEQFDAKKAEIDKPKTNLQKLLDGRARK